MPVTIPHPTSQVLAAFAKGQLPEAAAATVARHLESCAACRQAASRLAPGRGSTRIASGSGLREPVASSSPALALPPELADHPKYRIVRELGRGGMGVVYQAVQTLMDRPVAIKVINPSVLEHADALPRFQAEVKAAAKLDHPNIVRAYDADQVGSLHLLVMEFVEGRNLADVVQQKGPLPIAHACHYIRQAALGLQHAFEQGMTHRDIKPHNLMLASRGVVKILDFGLARLRSGQAHESGLTASGSFMGTPDYVAPEQATDARTADTRSDLYSLGCTLYHLLTGRPPFQEHTTVKLVLAHLEKEPPPLPSLRPDVPAELAAVVSRLLAKDPAQRYQTPVEMAQTLVPFIKTGAMPPPAPVTPPVPTASPARGTITGGDTSRQATLGVKAAQTAPAVMEAIVCDEPIEIVQPADSGRFKHWPILAGVGGVVMTLALAVGALAALGKLPFGAHHNATPVEPVSVTPLPEPTKSARLTGTAEEEEAIRTTKDTLSKYVEPHKIKERQRAEAKQIRTWATELRLKLETAFNEELSRVDAEYRKRARAASPRKWVQEIREWSRLMFTKRSDCKEQAGTLARAYMVDLQAAYTRYEEYVGNQFAEVLSIEELARRHTGKATWKQIADRYAQILPAADKALQRDVQAAGQRATESRDEFVKVLGGYLDRFAEQQAQALQPKEDTPPPPVTERRTSSPSRGGRKHPRSSREHHATPAPPPRRLDAEAEARKDYNLAHELYKSSIDSNSGAVPDSILGKVRERYQKIMKDYPETKAAEDAKKELKRISNL